MTDEVGWEDVASVARVTVYHYEDGEPQEVFRSPGDSVNRTKMPM